MTLARRLVVDRCLYGVDKNRLAVEMAKLSLWLVTLDKNRPFTFLDHALRHGDSLIGADEEMFLRWAHGLRDSSMPLFDQEIRRLVAEAKEKRQALQAFDVRDVRDAEEKARLLAEAEAATERIKLGCDLLVGARMLDDLSQSEQDALLANGLLDYMAGKAWQDPTAERAVKAAKALRAFHWPFEFPEVFVQGGFNAFIGNPPFLGGTRISTMFGETYLNALKFGFPSMFSRADLCALFFLNAFNKMKSFASFGLIATNTIAQGDTRVTGLLEISNRGGTIYYAHSTMPWPGQAGVDVSVVHIAKGMYKGRLTLDGSYVENITSHLDDALIEGEPKDLKTNSGLIYNGSKLDGIGFVLDESEAFSLLEQDGKNRDVVFPYLGGGDLNSNPDQKPSRWVINFSDMSMREAQKYETCFQITKERVYVQRQSHREKRARENWWQFQRTRPELYQSITELKQVLVITGITKYIVFAFVPNGWVYNKNLYIVASESRTFFSVLQSSFHDSWAWKYSSTMRNAGINYAPSKCFDNFPFPSSTSEIESLGESYHEYRRLLMLDRNEGLTATYNRFHNPEETAEDITHLRQLHVEMDNAVAAAYGWQDLPLNHDFHETPQGIRYTISEAARRQVLTRLLKLNHQRYEEEVKLGLHGKKKSTPRSATDPRQGAKTQKEKGKKKKNDGQLSLF